MGHKYLWYSGATDVTGMALAEALHIIGTKTKPKNLVHGDLVIGWGVKTDEATDMGRSTTWNSPNAIRVNRNKLGALQKMSAHPNLTNCIAKFSTAQSVLSDIDHGRIKLTLIGRTKSHQGGKGLWVCPTKALVSAAIADGATYFQEFIDVKTEYRLHVAFGAVHIAVKKEENIEPGSWKAIRKEKIDAYAAKKEMHLDTDTLNAVLDVMFKEAVLPDRIIKSNGRGWKFVNVTLNNVPAALKNAAVSAVEALGLQFGAVDCAITHNGSVYIIEVNSGPGLQGSALNKYVELFAAKIAEFDQSLHAAAPKAAKKFAAVAGVGAEAVKEIPAPGKKSSLSDEAMVHLMNAVQSPDEARRVLDLLMGKGAKS